MSKNKQIPPVPILLGDGTFRPTALCQQVTWLYLDQDSPGVKKFLNRESDKILSLGNICEKLGKSRSNAVKWKSTLGWSNWFNSVVSKYVGDEVLPRIHLHLADLATRSTDASLLRLCLDKFDPTFIPHSRLDSKHTFPGYEPQEVSQQDIDDAIQRSKRRIAGETDDLDVTIPAEFTSEGDSE